MPGGTSSRRTAEPARLPRNLPPAVRNAAFMSGLPLMGFDLIMADPPWLFRTRSPKGEAKSPQSHYRCMELDDICALPVGWLAAPNAVLLLWATAPMLRQAFHVVEGWGFRYGSLVPWVKRTSGGKVAMGTGYVVRSAAEPLIIGLKGAPRTSRALRNLIESVEARPAIDGLRREHSAKPEEAYAWAEAYSPGARRLDLFSRRDRPGWTAAGDEVGKLNPKEVEVGR